MQFKKRSYLGKGYVHTFKNKRTGDIKNVPCTQAEYERLGEKDGKRHNPTLEGYDWIYSAGGTIKVDTPDTVLGEGDYCETERDVIFIHEGQAYRIAKNRIDADGRVDDADITPDKRM